MTGPNADDFAFSNHANELRRAKAIVLARWLFEHGMTADEVESMNEDEQRHAEREAGKARLEKPKPLTTQHRPLLWSIVLVLLREKYAWIAKHTPRRAYQSPEVLPLTPCDLGCQKPVRWYPCGLRCDEHAPSVDVAV